MLTDATEDAMVRHEAAEALGAIADPLCLELLQQHVTDPEPIVADSCIVALDMMDHELSNSFQYAAVTCSDEQNRPQKLLPQEQPV